jgi:RimJ/RimL family protein N-acetyltransferase
MQKYIPIHLLNGAQYDELARGLNEPSIVDNLGSGTRAWSLDRLLELREYSARDANVDPFLRKYFYWVIMRDEKTIIGIIGFHPVIDIKIAHDRDDVQIMYAIFAHERGHGYASTAIRDIMAQWRDPITIMEHARVRLRRAIWAIIRDNNVASERALIRSGAFAKHTRGESMQFKRVTYNIYRAYTRIIPSK